jgi:hypothetical protein
MHFRTFLPPARPLSAPSTVLGSASTELGRGLQENGAAAETQQRSSSGGTEVGLGAVACACGVHTAAGFPGHAHAPPAELVALEEVAEDSQAVHHQLGGPAHGKAGSDWRYALPTAAAAAAAADGLRLPGGAAA